MYLLRLPHRSVLLELTSRRAVRFVLLCERDNRWHKRSESSSFVEYRLYVFVLTLDQERYLCFCLCVCTSERDREPSVHATSTSSACALPTALYPKSVLYDCTSKHD